MAIRLVHVVESFDQDAGSLAVSLRGLIAALHRQGAECTVIHDGEDGGACAGATCIRFDPTALAGVVASADVVHLHQWDSVMAHRVATAARKAGRPYVISPNGDLCPGPYARKRGWPEKLRAMLSEKKLLRSAVAVTAVNELEAKAMARMPGRATPRVMPYGLEFAEFEKAPDGVEPNSACAGESPDGRCLLVLGPIRPVEGVVPLLKAFAEIGQDAGGWSVVLAGRQSGPWGKMIEAAIRRKGATDRVRLAPAPDPLAQRGRLAGASVLVAPGLRFGCPVSVMQAVAAGVPVMASDRLAPDALIDVMEVTPPTREAFRTGLRSMLTRSDAELADIAARARERGRATLDWSVLSDQYMQLYRDVQCGRHVA